MKKCSKCGWENADINRFCISCNNELEETIDNTVNSRISTEQLGGNTVPVTKNNVNKAPSTKKRTPILIGVISTFLVVGLALIFGLLLSPKNTISNDTSNSLIQANMTSWGYAVYDGEDTYFSDGNNGIYRLNEYNQKVLFIEGNYSDMGLLDDTIYCVEYQRSKDTTNSDNVIVGINITNGKKSIIYEPPSTDTLLISVNVVNNKYYFVVDNDTLYSVDAKGKVENTGIRYAKKVTESGIYTTDTSKYGLKLISFDGKTIETYSELSEYEVDVNFELGDNVYLHYKDEDSNKIYCMNKNTGKLSLFPNDKSFFENNILSYINYYEGTFYISTSKISDNGEVEYNVYSMNSDGKNIRHIYSQKDNTGLPFCTINIVDKYLIISIPITAIEPEIINLEQISSN